MSALLVVLLLQAAPEPSASHAPPAPLVCLAKYYGVKPVFEHGEWYAEFPDQSKHRYDDHKQKSFDERLDAPDLEDMFSQPYRRGPITPIVTVNEDPGRIRYDPLFYAVYGKSAKEVPLKTIRFLGQKLQVNRTLAPRFAELEQKLRALVEKHPDYEKYLTRIGGTFNWRVIARTTRQSAHSFGVSMDLNVAHSAYWQWQKPPEPLKWRNEIPQEIVDTFESMGFIWGGRWYHYDTMHFEYRPELLDPACVEGPR